jgi:hypothetical protein
VYNLIISLHGKTAMLSFALLIIIVPVWLNLQLPELLERQEKE